MIKKYQDNLSGRYNGSEKADNLVVQVYNNLVPSLRLLKHQLLYVTERDETADDSVVVVVVP